MDTSIIAFPCHDGFKDEATALRPQHLWRGTFYILCINLIRRGTVLHLTKDAVVDVNVLYLPLVARVLESSVKMEAVSTP